MKTLFARLAETLKANEATIVDELNSVQGQPVDIDGYFRPSGELASQAMRPSETLNNALSMVAAD